MRTRSSTLEQELRETEASVRDERGAKTRRRVRLRIDVDETRGVDLAEWLETNRPTLVGRRGFYVVRSSLDVRRSVFKFGFFQDPSRLQEYIHMYGPGEVKLHILLSTWKDANVRREDSFMYRLELRVKRKLTQLIQRTKRGAERVACPLDRIRRVVFLSDVDALGAVETFDTVSDVLTRVQLNRSRRLRAARGLPDLPAGVGRGS